MVGHCKAAARPSHAMIAASGSASSAGAEGPPSFDFAAAGTLDFGSTFAAVAGATPASQPGGDIAVGPKVGMDDFPMGSI